MYRNSLTIYNFEDVVSINIIASYVNYYFNGVFTTCTLKVTCSCVFVLFVWLFILTEKDQ